MRGNSVSQSFGNLPDASFLGSPPPRHLYLNASISTAAGTVAPDALAHPGTPTTNCSKAKSRRGPKGQFLLGNREEPGRPTGLRNRTT